MDKNTFEILILIGRPASGKSEIIDFLQRTPLDLRQQKYHIGELIVLDDFPMLWTWFEEDQILSEKLGQQRLHTDELGYFKYPYLWPLLIERLSLEYQKKVRDNPTGDGMRTFIIEFARGVEHGGYAEAFPHLSSEILSQAAVLYVAVSYAESFRKNKLRFNPDRPDSILEHGLPDEKLTRLYRDDDWAKFSAGDQNFLSIGSSRVPYAIFENEDDVSSGEPALFAARLEKVLAQLWLLRSSSKPS